MTKTLAAAQITWFAKASFLKQNNQNLHLKLKKKKLQIPVLLYLN